MDVLVYSYSNGRQKFDPQKVKNMCNYFKGIKQLWYIKYIEKVLIFIS